MEFFTTSTANLLTAAKNTGVGRYVAVWIVGCDLLPESGYMRAKAITFEQMARDVLAKQGEAKTVVVDPQATYFGTPLSTNSLVVP